MAEIKGETSEEGVVIREMPTHQEFASRISTNREAVNTELNRLMKVGYLSRMEKGKGLNINDLEGLRASIECKD
ncbi:helix-turn-helix domain-containing protein [Teredinibacter franksiae]|uniref:helix-turn-helix domain-containing protein n=1 Tax=Teredinibacter franksiae TaxID=2761453 RepID=UPI001C89C480|nr:helix-turn-helix domain-containing protein [Teredinibacter franksiae]